MTTRSSDEELPILDDLRWRGLLADSTDPDALAQALAVAGVTFYCGFDPTAPSLHVGHLVQVITMARLQRAGHRPLVLVGGATGLIGDPKPNSERSLVTRETADEWTGRLRAQLERFFAFTGPNAATMVDNREWTEPLSTIDFLREVGKHFSVNRMLDREAVRARLSSDSGLSFTEFSYVLLQSHDYLELFRRYGCSLQIGGSDQWGNITAGVDLVRRVEGAHLHALTTPLLTKADGTKFGKTEGGAVWLSPELTSPYDFYQYWVNVDDRDVIGYLKALTFFSEAEIRGLQEELAQRPAARAAQRALAASLTTLVHSAEETAQVQAAAAALFGRGNLADLDAGTLTAALRASGLHQTSVDGEGRLPLLADVLAGTGLSASKGAARRTIGEGGAYVNNVRVADVDARLTPEQLIHGSLVVLRRGRRHVAGLEVGQG